MHFLMRLCFPCGELFGEPPTIRFQLGAIQMCSNLSFRYGAVHFAVFTERLTTLQCISAFLQSTAPKPSGFPKRGT